MKIGVNVKPKETNPWISSQNQKSNNFSNINVSYVTDNKSFWQSVKPYFNNKGSSSSKIILVENDAILLFTTDRVISKTMNKFFINTTKKTNLKLFQKRFKIVSQTSKQMTLILDRYN